MSVSENFDEIPDDYMDWTPAMIRTQLRDASSRQTNPDDYHAVLLAAEFIRKILLLSTRTGKSDDGRLKDPRFTVGEYQDE